MSAWEFLKAFGAGVLFTIAGIFWLAKGASALKALWPKRPKLTIEAKSPSIEIGRTPAWFWAEKAQLTLSVNNTGSRICSVTEVKLKLPNGTIIDLKPKSATFPVVVTTEKPEEIRLFGLCREWEKLNEANDDPKRPEMFPKQDSVETTILISIHTKKRPIKLFATFTINRLPKKNILIL